MLNIFLCVTISILLTINSYAATPSDYVLDEDVIEGLLHLNDYEDQTNLIIDGFEDYDTKNEMDDDQSIDLSSTSTGSAAESIKNLLLSIFLKEEDPENIHYAAIESPAEKKSLLRANNGQDDYHKNVVVYHGRFNGYDADLVVPYGAYSSLDVIDNVLVNVGNSSVTGRILYPGDVLSPSEYDTYSYVMNPVYGSTSNVYQYGSFNYRRHYYLNTSSGYNRITYDDMYGNFYVDDIDVYYSASERTYYILMVILLFMGVNALWSRKH